MSDSPRRRRPMVRAVLALVALSITSLGVMPASAASYQRISGEGSTWAGNAVQQWQADVATQGVTVDFTPNGSSQGRKDFAGNVNADFAVSEIPYKGDTADPKDSGAPPFNYALMPMVSGGTSFMYNLPVNGSRFEKLRLSQKAAAAIFTGQITRWNDPLIAADNPGVNLPAADITVVVRSEGSGATAQFTLWLLRQFPDYYKKLCSATGQCDGTSATSYFPTGGSLNNFVAQSGSTGVTTYTANTQYTISYDEYSYAQQVGFPVANLQNGAGYYTVPSDTAVAVALTKAKINTDPTSDNYLSQDLSEVYTYKDPRAYALSAYSYFIVPTQTTSSFSANKGATLGYFSQYSLCEGQQTMGTLGYSPLPMNLVLAALAQVEKIPGIDATTQAKIDAVQSSVATSDGSNPCNNPTFRPGDDPSHNVLVDTAPFPSDCNATCQAPWKTASAGNNQGPGAGSGGPKTPGKTPTGKPSGTQTNKPGSTDPGDSGDGTPGGTPTSAPVSPGGGDGVGPGGAIGGDAGAPVCDADTGECSGGTGGSDPGTGTDPGTGGKTNVVAVSTQLAGDQGWAGPQSLMVVAGITLLLLIIGVPLASQAWDRRVRRATRRHD